MDRQPLYVVFTRCLTSVTVCCQLTATAYKCISLHMLISNIFHAYMTPFGRIMLATSSTRWRLAQIGACEPPVA